jgi:hypothetical protein
MQQREGVFDPQQEWEPMHISGDEDLQQELVNQNQKNPQSQDQIRCGIVLLADERQLNKCGDADACNKEHSHDELPCTRGEPFARRFSSQGRRAGPCAKVHWTRSPACLSILHLQRLHIRLARVCK